MDPIQNLQSHDDEEWHWTQNWTEHEPESRNKENTESAREETSPALIAEHLVDPYWLEMGWKPEGNRLVGYYRTQRGSYEGYISDWQTQQPLFFIISPPSQLKSHLHVFCFRPRGGGLYWVHFNPPHSNVDAGIIEIETVLAQALAGTHQLPPQAP